MTLLQLADLWFNNKITEQRLIDLIPTIKIYHPNLSDKQNIIWTLNDGNSWTDVKSKFLFNKRVTVKKFKEFHDLIITHIKKE